MKKKQQSEKLEKKFKEYYYIYKVLLNRSYRLLKTLEGNIIKIPINRELLKRYYSRENYISYIII